MQAITRRRFLTTLLSRRDDHIERRPFTGLYLLLAAGWGCKICVINMQHANALCCPPYNITVRTQKTASSDYVRRAICTVEVRDFYTGKCEAAWSWWQRRRVVLLMRSVLKGFLHGLMFPASVPLFYLWNGSKSARYVRVVTPGPLNMTHFYEDSWPFLNNNNDG